MKRRRQFENEEIRKCLTSGVPSSSIFFRERKIKKSNDSASMSIILYLLFEEGGPKVGRTLTFGLILHARKARSP